MRESVDSWRWEIDREGFAAVFCHLAMQLDYSAGESSYLEDLGVSIT
jgi:hypothetical protein